MSKKGEKMDISKIDTPLGTFEVNSIKVPEHERKEIEERHEPLGILTQIYKSVERHSDMTINVAIEELIKAVPKDCIFDTHHIINNLIKKYSDAYLAYAASFKSSYKVTLTLHGNIGKEIAKLEPALIERMPLKSYSDNVHGESSVCACWRKLSISM